MSEAAHPTTETDGIDSPAEDEFRGLTDDERTLARRMEFIDEYGYSVTTREAARCVARHAPEAGVLSAGAGNGYDAHLFEQAGVDVRAVDVEVPDETWTDVEEADAIELAAETERALYVAWPPRNVPLAEQLLDAYEGETLIYAGEPKACDPNNEAFHDRLAANWTMVATLDLPSWPGINDNLTVYRQD